MAGAIFLQVLRFVPVSFIPPMLHTHSFIQQLRLITVADSINTQYASISHVSIP